ncbi:MAG: hypothetical protein AB7S69_14310 [Salinivirgaceae bacterium]
MTNHLNLNEIDYNEAVALIEQIERFNLNNKSKIDSFEPNNPKILFKFNNTTQQLSQAKAKLEEFSKNNRPLDSEELKKIIFSSNDLDISFIKAQCTYVGGNKREKAHYLYNLDVCNYYDDLKKSSDLQKEVFKQSNEYKIRYEDLKDKREKLISASYITIQPFKDLKFDLKSNAFKIHSTLLRSNVPYSLQYAKPPKCLDYIELLQLPFKLYKQELMGYVVWEEFLLIEMNMKEALIIEENGDDVELIFIFGILDSYNKEYTFISANGDLNLSSYVFKTNYLRVIAHNTKTNDVYYNRLYK